MKFNVLSNSIHPNSSYDKSWSNTLNFNHPTGQLSQQKYFHLRIQRSNTYLSHASMDDR